jgi:dTMP kinase
MNETKKGKFITLEGPEGAGKSTQARMLAEYLQKEGLEVVRSREPGGVSIAEQLREILLDTESIIYPKTEILLYASGRAQHTQELIIPALESGKCVICERYTHASIAYQGYGRGLDMELIKQLNVISTSGLDPDFTVVLDIDVIEGLKRVRSSNRELDRLESENVEFHRRVREGYLKIASESEKVDVIDSSGETEDIHKKIVEAIKRQGLI